MLGDQHLGDARAGLVELGRPMRRLAEQHDAAVGEALGKLRELIEIAERLGRFGDQAAQPCANRLGAVRRYQHPFGEA